MVFLVALMVVSSPPAASDGALTAPVEPFDLIAARGVHIAPMEQPTLSKKEQWRRDKELRPDLHVSDAALAKAIKIVADAERDGARKRKRPGTTNATVLPPFPGIRVQPIVTLFNIWTREALPVLPGDPVESRIHSFLRDHYTNQATRMDTRLVDVLTRAARKFRTARIEVVSGYRSPKYNLMLRKKGHQVARSSQHVEGNAVDFRIRGVPTKSLLHFVRSLRLGGVGFYPHSQFVHSDTGRVRYWTGS